MRAYARMRVYVHKSCVNIEEARSTRSNLRRFDPLSCGLTIRYEISEDIETDVITCRRAFCLGLTRVRAIDDYRSLAAAHE